MQRLNCQKWLPWICTGAMFCLATCSTPVAYSQVFPASLSPEAREQLYGEVDAAFQALERQGNLLKNVVRLVTPTVVHIEATIPPSSNNNYRRKSVEEAGSGVIIEIDETFYVITNRHVIDNSPLSKIEVRFADGRTTNPTNVWSDRTTDVAVMAIDIEDLVSARIGNSDNVEIGDFVLAVGSPFGLSHSVTYGIISAKGRRDLRLGNGDIKYQDFMQTDAAINPGNSGGPLLNLRGEVVGINTAIASSSGGSEGIGFTIPVNMAVMVARQLVSKGRTTRAYMGVRLYRSAEFTPEIASRIGLAQPRGALVRSITPDAPADAADLQPYDVVIQFDGRTIEDDVHLVKVVGFTPVGKDVAVVVLRGGKRVELTLRLDDRSRFEGDG
ncbi:MAG: trypsin-like peptidase domain-containing protein [Pirellulaceae bacterium]|nr:trypsin-like peptidase domain-containing protein [Pirellulaceae bacterium]MDP6719416.1 trypsin-like peptidase domain-containing protein [Pirellulaceae bacterium]